MTPQVLTVVAKVGHHRSTFRDSGPCGGFWRTVRCPEGRVFRGCATTVMGLGSVGFGSLVRVETCVEEREREREPTPFALFLLFGFEPNPEEDQGYQHRE